MSQFIVDLRGKLIEYAKPERAEPMEKYMKNRFPFLGIKMEDRRKVFKEFIIEKGLPGKEDYTEIVKELFDCNFREFHYCGMELMKMMKKFWKNDSIKLIEHLIITNSWWDTVDFLAVHLAGSYFQDFPNEIVSRVKAWMGSENIWLQRSAILFQLKYKEKTDTDLLFILIAQTAESKEFFLRKAAGWALRELSKTNPTIVKKFVLSHNLSGLTVREASKYLP